VTLDSTRESLESTCVMPSSRSYVSRCRFLATLLALSMLSRVAATPTANVVLRSSLARRHSNEAARDF
jgi:hypothetical protein